jgi:hypothetical protein
MTRSMSSSSRCSPGSRREGSAVGQDGRDRRPRAELNSRRPDGIENESGFQSPDYEPQLVRVTQLKMLSPKIS